MKPKCLFSLLACWILFWNSLAANPIAGNPIPASTFANATQPLLFMENRGQVLDQSGNQRPDILFLAKGAGVKIAIASDGIHYQFEQQRDKQAIGSAELPTKDPLFAPTSDSLTTYRLDMQLLGANPHPAVLSEKLNPYYENYYNIVGAPEGILGVRAYERITLKNVYPGIDWVIYSHGESMKYDFVVHPGADPTLIKMKYEGAVAMLAEKNGLTVKTPLGEVREEAPASFSEGVEIPSWFELEDGVLSVALGEYDPTQELVIDPALLWGTYYGGASEDRGYATAIDPSNNVYLAGYTESTSTISSGGHQNTLGGGFDALLVKFNDLGVRIWSTYYGGTTDDYAHAVTTDALGNVFMAGNTNSNSNIASGGHQNSLSGVSDAFLIKFNATGVRSWGTYYGGSLIDNARGVATDASGNIYLAGHTASNGGIATAGGHQNSFAGATDGFLAKFSTGGVRSWATYYGGAGNDYGLCVTVSTTGKIYLGGNANSTTGIAMGGHQNTNGGGTDSFVAEFSSSGTRNWGTYYGGSGIDYGYGLAAGPSGTIYFSGMTNSATNIASGGHQNTIGGSYDAFLVKFDGSGVRTWATYYGGSGDEPGYSTATNSFGNVFLAGYTSSASGIASGGYQNTYNGSGDAYLVEFNAAGTRAWGTYCGGTDDDTGLSLATAGTGAVYMAGTCASTTNIASGGHQNAYGGGYRDAFLVKIQGTVVNLAPIAICQNVTVNANGGCQGTATASQFNNGSSDPESDPLTFTVSPVAPYALGVTNVVLSVSDGQGHTTTCSATVTVTDVTVPSITCPANITTNSDPGICQAYMTFVEPVGTDNCLSLTTLIAGHGTNSSYTVGTTTNTYRVTDLSGNSATCSFTITVIDNESPSWILCPPVVTVNVSNVGCNVNANTMVPPVHDNCQMSLTITSNYGGTTFPVGSTPVTYTATDGAGNTATCAMTVTVIDSQFPTITCPPNTSVSLGVGVCSATVNYSTPVGSDNCSGETTTQTAGLASGASFPVGVTTNTFRVTDGSGNSTTCSFTVTVLDNQAPTAICQNLTLTLDINGNGSTTANAINNGSTDNCAVNSVSLSVSAFTCANAGANTVVLTVTDASGNTGTCAATVTVLILPISLSATAATAQCGYQISCAGATDGTATATGSGGCPPYSYNWSNGAATATVTGLGAGTYTVTVTDGTGGTAVQSVTLTAPAALQVSAISTPTCTGETDGSIDLTVTGGNDCQGYTYAWNNGGNTAAVSGLGAGSYTVTVTDIAGCTVTQSFTVAALALPQPTFTQSGNLLSATQTWSSYQWLLNGGAISGATASTYNITLSGTYALQVTDTNGCIGVSDTSAIVGIGEAMRNTELMLFPNPARGTAYLLLIGSNPGPCNLHITDLRGRLLFERKAVNLSTRFEVDLRGFAAGTYMVETLQGGLRRTCKLVVQ